jgi:hypothetical protein
MSSIWDPNFGMLNGNKLFDEKIDRWVELRSNLGWSLIF